MTTPPNSSVTRPTGLETPKECIGYLTKVRWPDGFACPRCGSQDHWKRGLGHFTCKTCEKNSSIRTGTIFEHSRTPLGKWLQALWWMARPAKGVTFATRLQPLLITGGYKKAWHIHHRLQLLMQPPSSPFLSDLVQIHDFQLFGKPILLMATIKGGKIDRIGLTPLPENPAAHIRAIGQKSITKNAVIQISENPMYRQLRGLGYKCETIQQKTSGNDGESYVAAYRKAEALIKKQMKEEGTEYKILPDPELAREVSRHIFNVGDQGHYTECERMEKKIERQFGQHKNIVHFKYLDVYLNEFAYRFNHRSQKSQLMRYQNLLDLACNQALEN